MAANPQLTPTEFAQKIKAQYPVYHDIPDAELAAKMLQKFPQYRDLVKTDLAPTDTAAPGSGLGQMATAMVKAIPDVAIGAGKGAIHTALDAASLLRAVPGVAPVTDFAGNLAGAAAGKVLYGTTTPPVSGDAAMTQARQGTAYSNAAQMVGGALETGAEMLAPIPSAGKVESIAGKAVEAVPTTKKAGKLCESVMSRAADVPVDTSAAGNAALRVAELAQRGGGTEWGPGPVRQLVRRLTDPDKGDMVYREARDWASNLSRLSTGEFNKMTPAVQREVANLAATFNQAVATAAIRAGRGAEYAQAMTQYAKAKKLTDLLDTVVSGVKRGLPYASAAGAGGALGAAIYQQAKSLFGE